MHCLWWQQKTLKPLWRHWGSNAYHGDVNASALCRAYRIGKVTVRLLGMRSVVWITNRCSSPLRCKLERRMSAGIRSLRC